MPGLNLSATIGADYSGPTLQANGIDGNAAVGLLNTDTLTASVWAGQDQPSLFAPTATWVNATLARFKLAFAASATSGLSAGVYQLIVYATRSGVKTTLADLWLELQDAPGAGSAPPVYCSAADVRDHLPFGDDMLGEHALAGFLDQRGRARKYLDGLILGADPDRRGNNGLNDYLLGYPGMTSGRGRSQTLVEDLAAGKLVLTPEVVEAVGLYAAYLTAKASGNKDIRQMAASLAMQADSAFAALVCEIDSTGTGYGGRVYPLTGTNFRG